MKGIVGIRVFNCPRVSHAKRRGFTLIETLLASFVLGVVLVSLFSTLSMGQTSFSISTAKVDLQSQVRAVLSWIIKDVRNTKDTEIDSNNPTVNHIKFRKVTGIDNNTGSITYASDYIEYIYDPVSLTLMRNEVDATGVVLKSLVFDNITQSPFYNGLEGPLQAGDIIKSWSSGGKRLIILVAGQKQLRGSTVLNFSLTEEAKVRNE